jgi:hypothetical protein
MSALHLELQSFSLTEVLEYEEIVKDMKENIEKFERTLFPANKLHEVIEKLNCTQSNGLKIWQRKALSILSLSRLYEHLIQLKLPKLQYLIKDVPYDIYSTYFNINK